MTDERLKPGNCHKCGLPLSDNPHPEAGKPPRYLEVGCPKECIPCLTLSRHQWAARAMKAENEVKDLLSASKPAVAPEGWKLVPVKPTREMVIAAHDGPLLAGEYAMSAENEAFLIDIYVAMLTACPPAPAQSPDEVLPGTFDNAEDMIAALRGVPAQSPRDACLIDNFSGRVCQHGTQSCAADHAPAQEQSYWTKEQIAAVREDARRLHAKLTTRPLVDDAPAPSGEPVGSVQRDHIHGYHMEAKVPWDDLPVGTLLYAAPPAQTERSLTDEQVSAALDAFNKFPCPPNGSICRSDNAEQMRAALTAAQQASGGDSA